MIEEGKARDCQAFGRAVATSMEALTLPHWLEACKSDPVLRAINHKVVRNLMDSMETVLQNDLKKSGPLQRLEGLDG